MTTQPSLNVLVIGGGGREHALAWKLAHSPSVARVFVAPGNAGTERDPQLTNVNITDKDALLAWAQAQGIDLTVVGPEAPLAAGVVDGGGVWMPPRPALLRIRDAIAEAPEVFTDLMHAPALKRRFGGLEREHMLQRMPRGYAPDHPAGEWLRFQSFTMGHALDEADLGSRTLVDLLVKDYTVLLPLVRWINSVSGLPEATRR